MSKLEAWMTPSPQVAEPSESVLDALDRMADGGFRHLPVVNAQGALIGVVSIDDLRAALPVDVGVDTPLSERSRAAIRRYQIADLMTYLPVSASAQASLAEAVHELLKRRIGCLPVVDAGGAPIGMFTESDALRALLLLLSREGCDGTPAGASASACKDRASALDALADDLCTEQARIREALVNCQSAVRSLAAAQRGEASEKIDAGPLAGMLAKFAARRLVELTAALDRHRRGTLGVCASCAAPIAMARLRALPGIEQCARCACTGEPLAAAS